MAYSLDFRKKVLAYCKKTGSIIEAVVVFDISRDTIYQWLKLMETTGGASFYEQDPEKLNPFLKELNNFSHLSIIPLRKYGLTLKEPQKSIAFSANCDTFLRFFCTTPVSIDYI